MIVRTPLHQLTDNIHIKVECLQPTGSIKYRTAWSMVNDVSEFAIRYNLTIVESSSANTGVAVAYLCGKFGIDCIIIMPNNTRVNVINEIYSYGAEVILTPKENGSDGAKEYAQNFVLDGDRYLYLDQYSNMMNKKVHYTTTGPEIWEQSEGKVTHACIGIGTGGTISGVGNYLKIRNPDIKIIGVQPKDWLGISGLRNISQSFVPNNYDEDIVDDTIYVSTMDAYNLYKSGDYYGGYSTMANIIACKQIPHHRYNYIVTIMPDGRCY